MRAALAGIPPHAATPHSTYGPRPRTLLFTSTVVTFTLATHHFVPALHTCRCNTRSAHSHSPRQHCTSPIAVDNMHTTDNAGTGALVPAPGIQRLCTTQTHLVSRREKSLRSRVSVSVSHSHVSSLETFYVKLKIENYRLPVQVQLCK